MRQRGVGAAQFWAANDLSEEQPIERGTGERAGTV